MTGKSITKKCEKGSLIPTFSTGEGHQHTDPIIVM